MASPPLPPLRSGEGLEGAQPLYSRAGGGSPWEPVPRLPLLSLQSDTYGHVRAQLPSQESRLPPLPVYNPPAPLSAGPSPPLQAGSADPLAISPAGPACFLFLRRLVQAARQHPADTPCLLTSCRTCSSGPPRRSAGLWLPPPNLRCPGPCCRFLSRGPSTSIFRILRGWVRDPAAPSQTRRIRMCILTSRPGAGPAQEPSRVGLPQRQRDGVGPVLSGLAPSSQWTLGFGRMSFVVLTVDVAPSQVMSHVTTHHPGLRRAVKSRTLGSGQSPRPRSSRWAPWPSGGVWRTADLTRGVFAASV